MKHTTDLFGNKVSLEEPKVKGNPMVALHGEQRPFKCAECAHLYYKQFSKKYYKCALRKNTNGPATDHQVNWPACGKFKLKIKQV